MTTEERKEAAAIMASDGPWDFRLLHSDEWRPCDDAQQAWDWSRKRYRIRPAPAPAPLPCPFCGHDHVYCREGHAPYVEYACARCGAAGEQFASRGDALAAWNRRQPCPSCQNLAATLNEVSARAEASEARAEKAEEEASVKGNMAFQYRQRAEAAEARCAEAARMLRQMWPAAAIIAKLEGRP